VRTEQTIFAGGSFDAQETAPVHVLPLISSAPEMRGSAQATKRSTSERPCLARAPREVRGVLKIRVRLQRNECANHRRRTPLNRRECACSSQNSALRDMRSRINELKSNAFRGESATRYAAAEATKSAQRIE